LVTIQQHFDVFIHTYVPTRGKKATIREDNLDSPFTQLNLIEEADGPIPGESGKREIAYAFRRQEKSEISSALFIYCLNDFWTKRHTHEKTLTFHEVAVGHGSPGQLFKLPEPDVRQRLDAIRDDSAGVFFFEESAASQRVVCPKTPPHEVLLANIYEQEPSEV
jgi:hypothetical protein